MWGFRGEVGFWGGGAGAGAPRPDTSGRGVWGSKTCNMRAIWSADAIGIAFRRFRSNWVRFASSCGADCPAGRGGSWGGGVVSESLSRLA